MIPNIFHFVFGMAPDFGGKPFSLPHYLAIRSAVELNKPEAAILHYEFEPEGYWWQQAKPMLQLNKIKAPDSFMQRPLYHVAHKADVIRLMALKDSGGIYLDLDTISVRPLADLLTYKCVIGQELKVKPVAKNFRQKIKQSLKDKLGLNKNADVNSAGLCNAVVMAEKNSAFINYWIDEYKSFRSKGRDKYWNEHSVQVPMALSKKYPDLVTLASPYAFHYPLYDITGLKLLFETTGSFPDAYLHHLWESFSWEKYLKQLTPESIGTLDTTYNLTARKFLPA